MIKKLVENIKGKENAKSLKENLDESTFNNLKGEILKVIEKYDESLSIYDFAKLVGNILEEDYGSHNYNVFFKEIKKYL
jgi:hypothetical protein